MRRIKSCPADIAKMINNKKIVHDDSKNNIIPFIQCNNIKENSEVLKTSIQHKKNIILNKKQFTNTFSGIISDTYDETNKQITGIDNYYYLFIVEFINNFLETKLTWKNFENLIYSLIIRVIVSDIYHEVIIKVKENVNLHVIK